MTKREKLASELEALQFFDTPEALRASAELSVQLHGEKAADEWLQLVWYGDECGGRLVRFRRCNPHTAKEKRPPQPYSEAERAEMRLRGSISRTKRRIYEISACNKWTWFFTGTLDGEKCDRDDLNGTFKRLSQFIRDYRKKQDGERVTYLIVPERHKSGAWHFHGLINGLSAAELHKFSASENIPLRLKKTIKGGTDVYTWKDYEKRFGWATFTAVRSHAAVAAYVTKYITKDIAADCVGTNRHLYYASIGLNRPQIIAEGWNSGLVLPAADFQNDYVAITALHNWDELQRVVNNNLSHKTDIKKGGENCAEKETD